MKPRPDHDLIFNFSPATVEFCRNPVVKLSYDLTTKQKSNVQELLTILHNRVNGSTT